MTSLKDFLEGYRPKSEDEQRFVDKHIIIKHPDRNGNKDDVFNASKVKKIDRKKERHGYESEEGEKIYESVNKVVDHLVKRYGNNIRKSHIVSTANDFGVDKSKLSRAVRKKLNKNMLDEGAENINELSKNTLGSYALKAKDDLESNAEDRGHFGRGDSPSEKNKYRYFRKQQKKRSKGLDMAIKKLTKEDIINKTIEKLMPEDYEVKTEKEKILENLSDVQDSFIDLISELYDSLNKDNKRRLYELSENEEYHSQIIDFALSLRSE